MTSPESMAAIPESAQSDAAAVKTFLCMPKKPIVISSSAAAHEAKRSNSAPRLLCCFETVSSIELLPICFMPKKLSL